MTPLDRAIALIDETDLDKLIPPGWGFRVEDGESLTGTLLWCPVALMIDKLPYPNSQNLVPSAALEWWIGWWGMSGVLIEIYDSSPDVKTGKRAVLERLQRRRDSGE